jgi:hypothetical protein
VLSQPPIQWVRRERRWRKCETDHCPPPSAKIKDKWHFILAFSLIFTAWCADTCGIDFSSIVSYSGLFEIVSGLIFLFHLNEAPDYPGM